MSVGVEKNERLKREATSVDVTAWSKEEGTTEKERKPRERDVLNS